MEPWARAMVMADEAEARGDAEGALDVIGAFFLGPDERPFWRSERVTNLRQVELDGPWLPEWVFSRWICNQAMTCLHEENRARVARALEAAVSLRGGLDRLPGVDLIDAQTRIMDRDWVFRQLLLYDLGGLDFFAHRVASSALLARAEPIADWSGSPMGGFRFESSTPATETWLDLSSGQVRITPNVGAAGLSLPGQHVVGRMVPIQGGELFETPPFVVPEVVAHGVAERPSEWLGELTKPDGLVIVDEGVLLPLLSDVESSDWFALITDDDLVEQEWVVQTLLKVIARELDAGTGPRADRRVDVWSCLGAALLDPEARAVLPSVLRPGDTDRLRQLGEILAEPAATVCRELADGLSEAA